MSVLQTVWILVELYSFPGVFYKEYSTKFLTSTDRLEYPELNIVNITEDKPGSSTGPN